MPANRIELLRQMPVFGGLKTEALELILRESTEVVAKEGDFFFREGERGDSVFVLETGTVLVCTTASTGMIITCRVINLAGVLGYGRQRGATTWSATIVTISGAGH